MMLNVQEVALLDDACRDRGNWAAQQLMNLFGVDNGVDVILLMPSLPPALMEEFVVQLWRAINCEHRKRTGSDLTYANDESAVA